MPLIGHNHRSSTDSIINRLSSTYIDADRKLFISTDSYDVAAQKAKWYFRELEQIVHKSDFLQQLRIDLLQLNNRFTNKPGAVALSSLEAAEDIKATVDSWSFLKKLSADKKLKSYLNKSVTYIFMRDLGKDVNLPSVSKAIEETVDKLHVWISKNNAKSAHNNQESFSTSWLYQKAKQHGAESTFIWLMGKLAKVQKNLPNEIDQTNGMRKLVKIIAGVVMHQLIDMPKSTSPKRRKRLIEKAIKLGYYYGLTYPLVDDLQDSASALNCQEKDSFNQAIRNSLVSGKVVEFPEFSAKNQSRMRFIYRELGESFEYIRSAQSAQKAQQFFQQAFIFFEAQDIDRKRKLGEKNYSYEEIFIPLILKSAGCRLIARDMLETNDDNTFDRNTFCFGIYNQFNDDIKDIFDDIEEGNVTPYTFGLLNHAQDESLKIANSSTTNPYLIYWAVVYYLIYKVYQNNPRCKQLILERSINAHKSVFTNIGPSEYLSLKTKLLNTSDEPFDQMLHELVVQPNDVAWFDKLVSRHVAEHFDVNGQNKEHFKTKYQRIQAKVDEVIPLCSHPRLNTANLLDAANYSLTAGGKRIRSVIAYLMMDEFYQLPSESIKPVMQLLEYMHTASIIFDDKPSQDNADFRRGKPTLHKQVNCEATAELAGIFLMMRAVEVQTNIGTVDPKLVLQSLAYAANTTQAICEGQVMDLQSKKYALDMNQLERMTELKTGLAIEAAFMIPAILADENDIQKGHIKQFARHLGLAFQIKDDLLDHEGDLATLGKPSQQDCAVNKSSFVTCLGENKAREKLFEHYFKAYQLSAHFAVVKAGNEGEGEVKGFMQSLLDYVVYREN
ncbi:polyprenyl synthetase family protein [Aliikangiella marina]|uniref:polyprenyl synthetase family protein n=1 Tax=Aliikangiella marina TaxID=1712262 RepID=UPI00163D42AE|nr:polyprenyl synthetase family protein [Aliikangiella marina]